MNTHQYILKELRKHKGKGTTQSSSERYLGNTNRTYYNISVPLRRKIGKDWIKLNPSISQKDFFNVLNTLFNGKSYDEKTIACNLLGYHPVHRRQIKLDDVDKWIGKLIGWAEIDSFCQSMFTSEELYSNWSGWEKLIIKLSEDKNINKRRASLVLLVGPVHYSDEKRFSKLAFKVIDTLKLEKEILITKAISWLLRSMTTRHKKEVSVYLKKSTDTLPKIAIRETLRKIMTGKK